MTGFCNIQSDFGHAPDPRRLDHMVSGLVHGGCKPFQESRSRSHASTWRGLPPLCIGFALGHTYFRKTERISFNNSITVTVPIFWSWFTEGVFCPSGPTIPQIQARITAQTWMCYELRSAMKHTAVPHQLSSQSPVNARKRW